MAIQHAYYARLLLLLLPSLLLWKPSHAAASSFARGETLSPKRILTSRNGDFAFGFFNLGSKECSIYPGWYVGIWYAKAEPLTVTWVANRDSPISAELLSSSFLTITNQSSLQLITNGSTIWSTKPSQKYAAAAVMRNDGNLMLFAAVNTSKALWQSFDEPGDTWPPGMKLGTNQSLCSWESLCNPAKGPFCLRINSDGTIHLFWNSSISYRDSGEWDGQQYSNIPEMWRALDQYNFSLVDLGSYKYFIYQYDHPGQQPLSRFWMHPNGQLQALMLKSSDQWSFYWAWPANPCDVYNACGAFASCNSNNFVTCKCLAGHHPRDQRAWEDRDWSAGCVRNVPFACAGDAFLKLQGHSLPRDWVKDNGLLSVSVSLKACRNRCLANCSCTAFATNGSSCVLWFGDLFNLREDIDSTHEVSLFLRLNSKDVPSSPARSRSTARKIGFYASMAAAAFSLVAVVTVWVFWRRVVKKRRSVAVPATLKVFSHKQLRVATRQFSQRIGGGGFGSVFKGTLPDEAQTDVAVKKLEGNRQGEKEFRTEVATVGQVQHVNVVRLLGFCSERRHRLLVYEFIANGSLASWLFGSGPGLDWKTRFAVAVGAARALEYLHEQCRDRIIHCDIKPENILLDAQFNAKVADFGLAKLLGRDFSRALTTMRGTRGYLAPEWLSGDPITSKADVYSFGMTLLEIMTGRRNFGGVAPSGFFAARAATEMASGNVMAVLDPRLAGEPSVDEAQVKRVACMALWCVQEDEGARPAIRDVLQVLQGVKEPPAVSPPVPPSMQVADVSSSFVFFWENGENLSSSSRSH